MNPYSHYYWVGGPPKVSTRYRVEAVPNLKPCNDNIVWRSQVRKVRGLGFRI